MNSKNILMLIPEFGFGGAEKSFCALSVELSLSYKVTIVVFNLAIANPYKVGGDIISLEISSSSNFFRKIINFIQRVSKFNRIKKSLKPHATISFLEGANYVNLLTAKKCRTIISIRGSKKFDQNISGLSGIIRKRLLIPFLYKKANKIITLSNGLKGELLRMYPATLGSNKISTIYNFINKDEILELANKSIPKHWETFFIDHKVLILSSRLAIEKGIQCFIPIFKELSKETANLKLIIIGNGPYQKSLEELCDELVLMYDRIDVQNSPDLKNKVYFFGYQQNPFMWIRKSNLFISASQHEGFGNSILEALLIGTPVISTDCPYGPREIIAGKSFNEQINYPFEEKNGTLLPIITKNQPVKELWLEVLKKKLTDPVKPNEKQNTYSSDLVKFEKNQCMAEWISVLEAEKF